MWRSEPTVKSRRRAAAVRGIVEPLRYAPLVFRSIWFQNARALAGASQLLSTDAGQRRAAMEVVVSGLPEHVGFLVACGVRELVKALESATPTDDDLRLARRIGCVSPTLSAVLGSAPNTIDVNVAPEGSLLFPGDPVATFEGPLWQVWLVAEAISSILRGYSTIATRAARLALAGGKGNLIDGTSTMAYPVEHAVAIARAAYIGGAVATLSPTAAEALGIDLRFTPAPDAVALSQDGSAPRTGAWAVQSSADNLVVQRFTEIVPRDGSNVMIRIQRIAGFLACHQFHDKFFKRFTYFIDNNKPFGGDTALTVINYSCHYGCLGSFLCVCVI